MKDIVFIKYNVGLVIPRRRAETFYFSVILIYGTTQTALITNPR